MSDYKKFKGEKLPKTAVDLVVSKNGFKYSNYWCDAYYKGNNPETATEWIIVTMDGRFYKVNAQYMIWSNNSVTTAWTNAHMHRTVKVLRNGEPTTCDPKYQT